MPCRLAIISGARVRISQRVAGRFGDGRKITPGAWQRIYREMWLKAPIEERDERHVRGLRLLPRGRRHRRRRRHRRAEVGRAALAPARARRSPATARTTRRRGRRSASRSSGSSCRSRRSCGSLLAPPPRDLRRPRQARRRPRIAEGDARDRHVGPRALEAAARALS